MANSNVLQEKLQALETSEIMRKTDLFYEHYASEIVRKYKNKENLVKESWLQAVFGCNNSSGFSATTEAIKIAGTTTLLGAGLAGVGVPTEAVTLPSTIVTLGAKLAFRYKGKKKAERITKAVTNLETAVKFGFFSGLALKIIYEQQISMINTNAGIESFAHFAANVSLKYFENCTERSKTPSVNELIGEFPNGKFSSEKVEIITGQKYDMSKMLTKPEPRKMVDGKWLHYGNEKLYKPSKYGYRTGIIQWPLDNEPYQLIFPDVKPVDRILEGYQPRFIIVGSYEWDSYCANEGNKSFNTHIQKMYSFAFDVRAVLLPVDELEDIHLSLPNKEGNEADFSKAVLPFFQRHWLSKESDTLDLTHLNFKGCILDGSSLENVKLKEMSGSSVSFAILDGTDMSAFYGDIKCCYPESSAGLRLRTETLTIGKSIFTGQSTADIDVVSDAEDLEIIKKEIMKILLLHEGLEDKMTEQYENICEMVKADGEKTRDTLTKGFEKTYQALSHLTLKLETKAENSSLKSSNQEYRDNQLSYAKSPDKDGSIPQPANQNLTYVKEPDTHEAEFSVYEPSSKEISEEPQVYEHEMPADLRDRQIYDAMVIHAGNQEDQEIALKLARGIEDNIKLDGNEKPKVYVQVRDEQIGRSIMNEMDNATKFSTFKFVILSKYLTEDKWARMIKDEALMEAIKKDELNWSVVPVHTQSCQNCDYEVPFGLRGLIGITFTSEQSENLYTKIRNVLNSKLSVRRERERILEQEKEKAHSQILERKLDASRPKIPSEHLEQLKNGETRRKEFEGRKDEENVRSVNNTDTFDQWKQEQQAPPRTSSFIPQKKHQEHVQGHQSNYHITINTAGDVQIGDSVHIENGKWGMVPHGRGEEVDYEVQEVEGASGDK